MSDCVGFSTVIHLFSVCHCVSFLRCFFVVYACYSPVLVCRIIFDFSVVVRLFSVYHYVAFFIFLQTYDGKRCVPGTRPLVSLLSHCKTLPGAIITPPGVCQLDCYSIVFRCSITSFTERTQSTETPLVSA